jgi:hypothetical protein
MRITPQLLIDVIDRFCINLLITEEAYGPI